MSKYRTLDNYEFSGKRVLLRADFNIPVVEGSFTDTARIEKTIPTLNEILAKGGSIVLISHLGRPNGQIDPKYGFL